MLYERSFRSLFWFVRCRAGADADATAEAVQETWMVAVRRIRAFDPARSSFEAWIQGIAINVLRNRLRREEKRQRIERVCDTLHVSPDTASQSDYDASRAEIANRVMRTLTRLPSHYQAILRARYHENRPVAAIADSLGLSRQAVESRLFRARVAFRTLYLRLERHPEEM